MLQVALVLRDQVAVDLAAREGARAAAVSAAPVPAATSAVDRALPAGSHTIAVDAGDEAVTVVVEQPVTPVPLVGVVVAGRSVVGRATMAIEPP